VFQMTNVRVSNDVMFLTDRNISNVFTGEKNLFFSSRVKLPPYPQFLFIYMKTTCRLTLYYLPVEEAD
jgi:hypothetical protein